MKYENKKTGKIATLISEDEKFKTVILQYEDGTTVTVTNPTLKRWWKKVLITDINDVTEITNPDDIDDDTYIEVIKKQRENLVPMPGVEKLAELKNEQNTDTEKELTDDEYAQIGKEIAQQAKQKAEDVKNARAKQKASGERPIDVAHKICKQFNQFNLTTAKNNVGIHVDKKRIIDIWGRSTKIRIYVSEDNAQFKTLDKKLYVVEGFAKGNLNKSIYVESANIEAVLTHLLNTKEAK